MRFEFATATRIVFGAGTVQEAPAAAAAMGSRPLIVTGAHGQRALAGTELGIEFRVAGEPTIELIRRGAELARDERCDVVMAVGGGSVVDAGKALAALITNAGEPLDYLEVVGRGQALQHAPVPFIAVPTTAGTGSEVTRNAVLGSPEHRVKASLRSLFMLPRLAIIDPELTLSLPPAITASTGLDALTQLIEPYTSARANPMTDMFCLEGMRHAARSLARAFQDGSDMEARTSMSWASLLGGLALANAALGAVHGFAAPIGGAFEAPHGAVCAALLPHALAVNLEALRQRAPQSEIIGRYRTIARILTGNDLAEAEDAVCRIAGLCRQFEIPSLGTYGVTEADIPGLAERAAQTSSMKGNPIVLTREELRQIAVRAL